MYKNLLAAAIGMLVCSSTALAQTDFREALRIAFAATVAVQTDDGGNQVQGRMLRRQLRPLGGFDMMQALALSSDRSGFAVGSNLIATQLPSDVSEVTIKTSEGNKLAGKVAARDYVTGLALVKIDGAELISLLVGAGTAEAGLPVVISRLGPSGAAYGGAGMIASGPATIDSQLGFTQYLSGNMNRGDIGAPLVDAKGVVMGIVGSGQNGNLICLPTAPLQRLMDGAAGDEPIDMKRGLVGIQFSSDGDKPVIMDVSQDSPASNAGIEAGDQVVRVNEYDVATAQDVLAAVAMSRAADAVPIVVQRGDETIELVVTLKDHPRQEFAQAAGDLAGFAQQAWELKDGKLVPLDGGDPRVPGRLRGFPESVEKAFEEFDNLIVPGLPRRLEGLEVERSDLEDSLRELEADKQDQQDEIKDLKKKLRDLQDKLQDS